ncbi:MAG: SGNH/GDSL hydrolase family protein [Acidobacteriaceae bacterium]|nr:SGNH/GDSL hydrolase family protein [Acidobacteriaceae bacterium]
MPPEQLHQDATPLASDVLKLQSELARDRKILQDWANLARYRDLDTQLGPPAPGENRVVFMGDSITDGWGKRYGKFFPDKPYVNRGISGQTTPQMLVRFHQDVIALNPKVVVILGGTNDIGGNTGPETLTDIEGFLSSMAQLARANGIRVVLSSVTPVCDYIHPQTQRRPPAQIVQLNAWMKDYCSRNGFVYLDYYPALLDEQGMFKKELTYDGLHPNDAGYAVMEPLAAKAIQQALARPATRG